MHRQSRAHPVARARHDVLSELGRQAYQRYEAHGNFNDLNASVDAMRSAASLVPDGSPTQPGVLLNFGMTLGLRYKRLKRLEDLEEAITTLSLAAALIPDGLVQKSNCLYNLALSLKLRFGRLRRLADIDEAIQLYTHALRVCQTVTPTN